MFFAQSDHVIDTVLGLAPAQDLIAAETRVGPNHNLDSGPLLSNLAHDPFQFFDRSGRTIDVGGSQPGTEQKLPTEVYSGRQ